MKKRYVMGDIHGNARAMLGLLDYVDPDPEELVIIGDLINRGLNSWGVMKEAALLIDEGATIIRGNHDVLLPLFINDSLTPKDFHDENIGCLPTYVSFKLAEEAESKQVVHETIKKVYDNMVDCHEDEDYIFVHAGIDPRVPYMNLQKPEVLRNGCQEWKNPTNVHCYDQYVVFGHTPTWWIHKSIPQDNARVWMSHKAKKIAIDTGAGFGEKLTMVDLYDGIAYSYDVVTREIEEYRFKRGDKR